MNKQILGEKGEDIAAAFLKKEGYKIVEQNYRTPFGEIDIIAYDGQMLAFIEVKARKNPTFAVPQLAVNKKKQQHIVKSAMSYISSKRIKDRGLRFDVIAISIFDDTKNIELFKNAFEPDSMRFV
ncbi:MAG: YraN family protein [Nitrospirae bacterium]|nr:YraN family protein [Nitrospirota bacterium]